MGKQTSSAFAALVPLVAAAALVLSACSREADRTEVAKTTTEEGTQAAPPATVAAERDAALVRAVNAIPQGKAAVLADETTAFPDLDYKTVTPYKELRDTQVTFKLQRDGQPAAEPADENLEMLLDGRHYTVVAMPGADEGERPQIKVLSDELVPPEQGKAKVRVVNASPDVGEVDVAVAGVKEPLISGLNPTNESDYRDVGPVSGKLIVRGSGQDGKGQVVAEAPTASIESGKIYTIFVMGRTKGSPRAEAVVVEDELVPTATTEVTPEGATDVPPSPPRPE
jgi:hypothetical protein